METIVSQTDKPNISVHTAHEFFLKMEKAGLSKELVQKIVDSKDNELAGKVVRFIQNGGFEPSTSQSHARTIMGKNFFGIEEAIKHFGVNPSKQQLAGLTEVPFSKEMLESCKYSHVLVAVFPMSVIDICGKVEPSLFYRSYDDIVQSRWVSTSDKGEIGWQLVRKVPVAESMNKAWNRQQELLSKTEETPKAQVMVYTIIGHFLATNEHLFRFVFVRCSDLEPGGDRVDLGGFNEWGLQIRVYSEGNGYSSTGLSAVMKQRTLTP